MLQLTQKSLLSLPLLLLLALPMTAAGAEGPTIAAATSLRDALPALAAAYAAGGGVRPGLSFGASGNLRRQIAQGAPFEVFLSADERFVQDLASEGHTNGAGAIYARGRLAILVPKGSALRADGTLGDLETAIGDGRLERFAIANPEHAPYGRAARETLQRLGLWERVQERLIIGENVSQAAQFAATGAAQGGIVAYSLALSPRLEVCCEQAPISDELHAPLRQRGALINGAGEEAKGFFAFLLGPLGQGMLKRHGFGVPVAGD